MAKAPSTSTTSGTSILEDGANGAFKGDKVYHDNTREGIDSVPDIALHRPIHLAVTKGQRTIGEAAKISICIPPLIYGSSHRRLTIQIPTITRFALKHGFVGHIGKGLSVESQIHIMDLARAYIVILHWMEEADPREVLANPYFFCENGYEASWKEVATEVGKGLHAAGKIKDPTPKEFSEDMYDDLFGPYSSTLIGLNSRSRAVRLRELGWQPREKGVWESYREDELPEILKEEGREFHGYEGVAGQMKPNDSNHKTGLQVGRLPDHRDKLHCSTSQLFRSDVKEAQCRRFAEFQVPNQAL